MGESDSFDFGPGFFDHPQSPQEVTEEYPDLVAPPGHRCYLCDRPYDPDHARTLCDYLTVCRSCLPYLTFKLNTRL